MPWHSRAFAGGALGASLLAALVAAQQPQTPTPPVFRSGAQYVTVDVIVTDRHDRPVTTLTKDDFEILERGVPQKIADFSLISVPLANRAIDIDAAPAPPVDVASNARVPHSSRAIAIVIDDTSIRPQDLVPLRRVLVEFLKTLGPDDQVALTWTSRSDLGQDFTNDTWRLVEAVNNRRAAIGLGDLSKGRNRIYTLRYVVAALASARQTRRAIFFVTGAACRPFPAGNECSDLVQKARRAGVPIYTLDPRLFTSPESVYGIGNIDSPEQRAALAAGQSEAEDSMKTLASATGGRAFAGISNPVGAVGEIMVENGSYYLLGYYPDPLPNDGKFHEIKVRVRKAGLRVRSRFGYTAPGGKVVATTPHRDMMQALGAGVDDPSLPIRAFVAPMAAARKGTRALVTIEVAYPKSETAGSSFDDDLRVGILALTPDAKIKASLQRPIKFTGTWKPGALGTFVVNEAIDLPVERLTLRVGVTSRALGRTGTAHVRIDVPDFGDDALQVSPLVLGFESVLDAAVGLDAIKALVPFQPTTVRAFSNADSIRVFARASWKSEAGSLTGTLSVTGPSRAAPQAVTLPAGGTDKTGHRSGVLDHTISLADLAPGSYVLRLEVRPAKGKSARREVPLDIK